MSLEAYLGLCVAMLVVAATPGPAVFAMVTTAFSYGLKRSFYLNLGIMLADYIFIGIAITGLSALATIAGETFYGVRLLCAGYLIWIGYKMFRSTPAGIHLGKPKDDSILSTILTGLFITLSNPKAILFYAALLPMFIDLHSLTKTDIVEIALTANLTFGGVNFTYALMADRANAMLGAKSKASLINKMGGSLMMVTGALTAFKS
jgi:threonine/homoserine/homoserine lactone efflux protein